MENTIQSDLIRGHINTIILKALFDGDRYGYDIVREIEQKSSGQYKLKQPTLYSCLKRLEIQGFIRSYWGAKSNGGRRKYFTLTDMGRELFIKNQSEWEYSRTVIDKLISDKEVDLSAMPKVQSDDVDEYSDDETIDVGQDEDEESESSPGEIIVGDSDVYRPQEDNPLVHPEEEKPEEPIYEPVEQVTFSDTTAIMDELLRRNQTDSEDSYTAKLSEYYEADLSDESVSTSSYFQDFYDETDTAESDTQVSQAVTPEQYTPEDTPTEMPEQQSEPSPTYTPPSAPVVESKPTSPVDDFFDYHTSTVQPLNSTEIVERDYKSILDRLMAPSFTPPPAPPAQVAQAVAEEPPKAPVEDSAATTVADDEHIEAYTNDVSINRKLTQIHDEVRDMGNSVKIRTYNNENSHLYNSTYYYYSNKLMLLHYGILFAVMLVEIIFTAILANPVLHYGRKSDIWVYVVSTLIALAFPITAIIKNFTMPNKQSRINFNMRNSLIYRFIVMAQCLLIVYCANLIGGMSLPFSAPYFTTVLLPALLSTNFPVSALIFGSLYKTGRYAVTQ